jgi:hypothetical protein
MQQARKPRDYIHVDAMTSMRAAPRPLLTNAHAKPGVDAGG